MFQEYILPAIVIIGFIAFIAHRSKAKKDGRSFTHRYSGGKIGEQNRPR